MESTLIADVGIDSRLGGSNAEFTYLADPQTRPGQAFVVPIGNRLVPGIVLRVRKLSDANLGFDPAKLRPLGDPIEGLDLPEPLLDTLTEVAKTTLCALTLALGLALPPKALDRLVTVWFKVVDEEPKGNTLHEEAFSALGAEGLRESRAKKIPPAIRRALLELRKSGFVATKLALGQPKAFVKTQSFHLSSDTSRIEAFLAMEAKRKPAQTVTVMRLQGAEQSNFTKQEIRMLAGVTDQVVKALIDAKILEKAGVEDAKIFQPPEPNPSQQAAIDAISASVTSHRSDRFLLYGVTGSGKTEVYLRCAEEALRLGRSILYVVPEIALTAQVVAQLKGRFGERVAVLHSNMSDGERLDSWQRIKTGAATVVLGPRSALFAPLADIGLIVMDEEHEASYKQETAPRYHSRNVAKFLADRHNCPLILGSATPSIETFAEASSNALTRLDLPSRAASASLPKVEVVDLREMYKQRLAAILSPPLHSAMESAFGRGEQVMLFLNRRAYSTMVICRDCGKRFVCPNCDIALSLHLHDRVLRCHHCDFTTRPPEVCPECGSTRVSGFGVGVEKVQEYVSALFPDRVVERLDRDVTSRKGVLEDILSRFRVGDIDCLVGTQMIAKGLDFPNVTVVGVVSADISLNIPDFRASERTFQLLSQVAGRAGRGSKPGKVIIQTLSPDHNSILTAQAHDYESLYKRISEERRAANYPPFCRLVRVVVSGASKSEVYKVSSLIGGRISALLKDSEVLGPVDCPLFKVKNEFRRHLLVKCPDSSEFGTIDKVLKSLKLDGVKVMVDVDPYSLS